jgi:hypothetical protein
VLHCHRLQCLCTSYDGVAHPCQWQMHVI